MATLFDLAQLYLNQALPDISGVTSLRDKIGRPVEGDPAIGPIKKFPVPIDQPEKISSLATSDNNFNVYNPDPTRLRTEKDYQFPFKFTGEDLPEAGDYIVPPRQGIMGFYDKFKNLSTPEKYSMGILSAAFPGAIPAALAVGGIGQAISSLLPPNRRGILENQALGAGFRLNDIGQIVAAPGSAYDPSGLNIMAGYNLNRITQATFDKRRANAKKNMTPEGFEEFNKALTAAEEKILGKKGINTIADLIYDSKMKKKDPTYQNLDEAIAAGLAEGDDDDDDFSIEDFIAATNPNAIPTGTGIMGSFPGMGTINTGGGGDVIEQKIIQKINEDRDRDRGVDVKKNIEILDKGGGIDFGGMNTGGRNDPTPVTGSGGGGPSYSGMGSIGSGGSTAANRSRTSSRVEGGRTRAYGL